MNQVVVLYYIAKVFVTLFELVKKNESKQFNKELHTILSEVKNGATIDAKRNAAIKIADLIEFHKLRKP
jgi:hypothetical protein